MRTCHSSYLNVSGCFSHWEVSAPFKKHPGFICSPAPCLVGVRLPDITPLCSSMFPSIASCVFSAIAPPLCAVMVGGLCYPKRIWVSWKQDQAGLIRICFPCTQHRVWHRGGSLLLNEWVAYRMIFFVMVALYSIQILLLFFNLNQRLSPSATFLAWFDFFPMVC